MAKKHSVYICSNCNSRRIGYFRICPKCGQFDTMREHIEEAKQAARAPRQAAWRILGDGRPAVGYQSR